MRAAREGDHIRRFLAKPISVPVSVPLGTEQLILDGACTIIGGRNGAGKSRLLRAMAEQLDESAVHVELHQLCERALDILGKRDDLDSMTEEFEPRELSHDELDDVSRVVGRDYEKVEWFALEIEPPDETVAARFRWGGEQSIMPYFRVQYRGRNYDSLEMGLGELSVHMLFWILEQYRQEEKPLTLLLDEPDAYLPPVGVVSLLARLSKICQDRKWQLVLTTHSEELIRTAVENRSFTFLQQDGLGASVAVQSADDPTVADLLLPMPTIERVMFCEDEVAAVLARELLESFDKRAVARTAILWGGGTGALTGLRQHIPSHRHPRVQFQFMYDGDQRDESLSSLPWGPHFLPSEQSPDELLFELRTDIAGLSIALGIDELHLRRTLESLEGHDPHDWVSGLGDTYGRQLVLTVLARTWVAAHVDEVAKFAAEFAAPA